MAYCEKFVCKKYQTCLYAPEDTKECRKLDGLVYQILDYRRSGKSFEIETMNGNKYRLLFMAGKKKEG